MKRVAPVLAGLVLVLGTGFLHGTWFHRWGKSPALEAAVRRLERAPGDVGDWQARPAEIDSEALALAGAEGCWARNYTHRVTGQTVLALLLCGQTGPLCVHRPEHCYQGAGYVMTTPAATFRLPGADGAAPAEFWTSRFTKEDATGAEQLRIFWSWHAGGAWKAPGSPRWTFARLPSLYKLYVVREVGPRPPALADEPAVDLLRQLLPELTRALAEDPGT